jgi:prepilin-type N-terminal cleavage/methylation domain-containing protein
MSASSLRSRPERRGFSLPELMVVVVLAAILVLLLEEGLMSQRRFYQAQSAVTQRHETLRFARAILSGALREANIADGDVDILAPGQMRVRVPYGLAFVCGTDATGQLVGVVELSGRWVAGAGDSVLVQRSGVWSAHALTAVGGISPQVPCVAGGGATLTLDMAVPDVSAGSGARSFRSHLFEIDTASGGYGLYRTDGATRELLLSPLDGATGFQAWYEDAQGTVLPSAVGAERVGVRVVARSVDTPALTTTRADTLTMTFGGRNR